MKQQVYYCLLNVGRNWIEDFIDEDTGDVVPIERF